MYTSVLLKSVNLKKGTIKHKNNSINHSSSRKPSFLTDLVLVLISLLHVEKSFAVMWPARKICRVYWFFVSSIKRFAETKVSRGLTDFSCWPCSNYSSSLLINLSFPHVHTHIYINSLSCCACVIIMWLLRENIFDDDYISNKFPFSFSSHCNPGDCGNPLFA